MITGAKPEKTQTNDTIFQTHYTNFIPATPHASEFGKKYTLNPDYSLIQDYAIKTTVTMELT